MNVVIKIKRFLRRNSRTIEVWDTSAISTWFDRFVESISKEGVQVVVPDGVEHELSSGKRKYENCRKAYEYIMANKVTQSNPQGKLKVYVIDDQMRAWAVDDQVIGIATKYYRQGYDVKLVTCDVDQCNRAKDRMLDVILLKGVRFNSNKKQENAPKPEKANQVSQPIRRQNVQEKNTASIKQDKDQLVIPCVRKGNELYISVDHHVSVYDSKGRRKIGRGELVSITTKDSFVYKEKNYELVSLTSTELTLKKMDSA